MVRHENPKKAAFAGVLLWETLNGYSAHVSER